MLGRIRIDDDQAVEPAEMFRLMGDPTRLKIILACLEARAVGEKAERLGRPVSLGSHHPRLLRADRRGSQGLHAVQDEPVQSMCRHSITWPG